MQILSYPMIVSILVLVDFALKLYEDLPLDDVQLMFQSLFWWILLLNLTGLTRKRVLEFMFQSLFWWILLLNMVCSYESREGKEFQSLFWWILLLNREMKDEPALMGYVSILVLVDFALKPPSETSSESISKFQSLFWWILLLNSLRLKSYPALLRCFNPCFGGFCS